MIYFDENFKKLTIPVSSGSKISKIILVNQAEEYEFTNFVVSYTKKNYVVVNFSQKVEIIKGQYDYKLLDEEDVIFEEGILQYGDYSGDKNEYQTENNIVVYEG